MTKRDFELFAAIIRRSFAALVHLDDARYAAGVEAAIGVEHVIRQACETFAYENPRFDAAKFRAACRPLPVNTAKETVR